MTLKNVLVATDFGAAAETALEYGRVLAEAFGATLHVVHVLENIVTGPHPDPSSGVDISPPIQRLAVAAERELENTITKRDREQLHATTTLLTGSSVAMTLLNHIAANGIDLLVIGTHGRGAMAKLLMGSVAEKLVRTAPCPVLTVRQPGHEFALQRPVSETGTRSRS